MKRMKKAFGIFAVLVLSQFVVKAQSIADAVRAIEVEQFDKAKNILRNLSNNPTTAAEALYYLGDAYIKTAEIDSARMTFSRGVEAYPSSYFNHIGVGRIQLFEGNAAAAKANFDKAIAVSGGKDHKTYLNIGLAWMEFDKKDLDQAKIALDKAVELTKKNKDAFVFAALGDYYLEKVDGTNAVNNYNEARNINKNFAYAYVREGQIYKRALSYQPALDAMQKAIDIDPNYAPAYRELAELYYSTGQFEKAIDMYKNKYIALTDVSCNSRYRYAQFLFLTKDYTKTTNELNAILSTCEPRPIMYRLLGYSQFENQNFNDALVAMEKFFATQPQNRIITSDYEYLGRIQSKLGKDSLAIVTLEKAIAADPSKTDLYGVIAEMHFRARNFVPAIAAYEKKFANIDRISPVDYFFYGQSLYFNQNYAKADTAFDGLISVQPNFINGYLYKARIQTQLLTEASVDKYPAKQHYEKVLQLGLAEPERYKRAIIEAYKYLGDYYFNTNNLCQSKACWTKILELEPGDQQAIDVLKAAELARITPCDLNIASLPTGGGK